MLRYDVCKIVFCYLFFIHLLIINKVKIVTIHKEQYTQHVDILLKQLTVTVLLYYYNHLAH
jgi:hypothetical protein